MRLKRERLRRYEKHPALCSTPWRVACSLIVDPLSQAGGSCQLGFLGAATLLAGHERRCLQALWLLTRTARGHHSGAFKGPGLPPYSGRVKC